MWRSADETQKLLDVVEHPDQLDELFALREFWVSVVYPTDYRANSRWPEMLTLTEGGQSHLELLTGIRDKFGEPDFYLALFGHFYHHDLIFDWKQCDITAIGHLLDNELRDRSCLLPHRFGRYLYDRFNDMGTADRTDHLLPEQVADLLRDAPQGVYQCFGFVSGPLGLLRSQEFRYLPPSLSLPLWHCSDTGCNALHGVSLRPPSIPLVKALQEIAKTFDDTLGPAAEWELPLARRHRNTALDDFEQGRRYNDLPVLLAETIIGAERTELVARALRTDHAGSIRGAIVRATGSERIAAGSPEDVAERLGTQEQLQLLLLLPDTDLIALVDKGAAQHQIKIPIGEVRQARQSPRRFAHNDSESELSAFGLRSISDNPWATLVGIICRAYTSANLWDDLEWRLRTAPEASVNEQLCALARGRGPGWVVEELIFKSKPITEFVCRECDICVDEVLSAEPPPTERLLWKLGFNPPTFADHIPRLMNRLSRFTETLVTIGTLTSEEDRERIRGVGVNLFVSVEDFLERLISFNVWLLKSDHFLDKFRFEPAEARKGITEALGQELVDGDSIVRWKGEGGNTIGTLMRYLDESVRWMESLLEADKDVLLRLESDLPFFADNVNRRFPFRHLELWADADRSELGFYVERFRRIAKFLQQAQLACVRNGLDHHREESQFPSLDLMLGGVARLREGVEAADTQRYFPKLYWLENQSESQYGWKLYEFSDYASRRMALYGPRMVLGMPKIVFNSPWIIAPGNLLGTPNANLLFSFHQTTEYTQYWAGYPRRRKISAPPV